MSNKLKSFLVYFLCFLTLILWISNPREASYLRNISVEYAKFHSAQAIPGDVIKKIGSSKRKNYLIFSTYTYQYGNMSFYYLGVANTIFFMGTAYNRIQKNPVKVV